MLEFVTSILQPRRRHNARVAGEDDVQKLFGNAVTYYDLKKVTTWDTTDDCFAAADVASTEAESRSASLVFPTEIDRSRTWINTLSQDPEPAINIARDTVIGMYPDSSLVMTNRTVGKKAKKGNAVHLLLGRHVGVERRWRN